MIPGGKGRLRLKDGQRTTIQMEKGTACKKSVKTLWRDTADAREKKKFDKKWRGKMGTSKLQKNLKWKGRKGKNSEKRRIQEVKP